MMMYIFLVFRVSVFIFLGIIPARIAGTGALAGLLGFRFHMA